MEGSVSQPKAASQMQVTKGAKKRAREVHAVSQVVRGKANPPDLPIQAVCTKRIRVRPDASVGSTWTPNGIAGYFPSGAADWQRFRIRSVEMWGPDVPYNTGPPTAPQPDTVAIGLDTACTVGPAVNMMQLGDARFMQDVGVLGQDLARIKWIPAQEYAMHWWNPLDTTSVCFYTSTQPLWPASGVNYTVDIVCDLVTTV